MNITDCIKEFDNRVTELYPDLELCHEYDADLDLYFIWYTNIEYDNDDTFELSTYRLVRSIFEDNDFYNVLFSSMVENHLTNQNTKIETEPTVDMTISGSYSPVDYHHQDDNNYFRAHVTQSSITTILADDKLSSIQNPTHNVTKCADSEFKTGNNWGLAA